MVVLNLCVTVIANRDGWADQQLNQLEASKLQNETKLERISSLLLLREEFGLPYKQPQSGNDEVIKPQDVNA